METIKKGSKGAAVKTLQTKLGITADGIFGANTETAVKNFQREKGFAIDGIVGAKTWAALGVSSNSEKPNFSDIEIAQAHLNVGITKCTGRHIKYIAVHYTAGASSKAGSAKAIRNVFVKRCSQKGKGGSADFAVDDSTIVQFNPDIRNYFCWSVGDPKNKYSSGGRLYGKTKNSNTISIEICSNLAKGASASAANHAGWTFTAAALDNARKLIRYLMAKYNVPKANVVRHYDVSGKLCPGVIGWNDESIYTIAGERTKEKNNSDKWQEFWDSI